MAVDKKAAIKVLFDEGWEQKDIARTLGYAEKTVSKYCTENNLRQKRLKQSLSKKTSEENALFALEHQTTVIRLIADKLSQDLGENPDMEQLKAALIPKGEIDAVQKLFTTIKGKELEWSAYVKIIREFTQYLKEVNIDLAQDVIDHADSYINELRRVMS